MKKAASNEMRAYLRSILYLTLNCGYRGKITQFQAHGTITIYDKVAIQVLDRRIGINPVQPRLAVPREDAYPPFSSADDGSYTERLAHILADAALEGVDTVIDLHGGGSWCVNAFVFEMAGGRELSHCFAAPFSMKAPDRALSLTGYARSLGKMVAAVEMGGRSQFEAGWAEKIADGLLRALCLVGVVNPERTSASGVAPLPVADSTVLRPSQGGIFVPAMTADLIGTLVAGGTLLGQMLHPTTYALLEEFRAPYKRTALLLLRPFMAQLEAGARTYVVARPAEH